MRKTLTDFNEKLTYKEKHSLAENLCEKVTGLDSYKTAQIVFAYIPDTLEADCTPIILDALEKGKKLCVPKVDAESLKQGKSEMDFYFLDGSKPLEEQLETGAYGIREPKNDLKMYGNSNGQSPFVLVPGVAFSKSGKRLGHGKGFYDIYIEKMRNAGNNPFLCGICLPCQIVEDLPTDEHDILMDTVISC